MNMRMRMRGEERKMDGYKWTKNSGPVTECSRHRKRKRRLRDKIEVKKSDVIFSPREQSQGSCENADR
jgi:hypothetical protein